jgi:hypothetical protein
MWSSKKAIASWIARGLAGGKDVIVVEDEHKPAVKCGDIVDERRDQRLDGRGLKGLKTHLARLSQADIDLLHSGDDIGEKAGQIVVSLV